MSDHPTLPPQPVAEKPRKRKWLRRLVVCFLLIGIAIVCLPPIVGRTALRNRIVPHLSPELAGRVSLGSASLGWLSPIGIDNLNIYDQDGTVLLHADRLQSRYTLLDLILEPSDLGEWTLSDSTLHLAVEPGTSNLEDFLNSFATDETDTPYSLSIQTQDMVLYVDRQGTDKTRLYHLPRFAWEHTKQNKYRIAGELVAETSAPGTIDFDLTSSDLWSGFLKIRHWDCSTLEPLAMRLGRDLNITGQISEADLLFSQQFEAKFKLSDLLVADSEMALAELRSLDIVMQLDSTGEEIRLKQLNCQSEFGTLSLDGEVRLPDMNPNISFTELADKLLTQKFSIDAEIQLKELANRVPGLLKIRDGVEIDGGSLGFFARSIPTDKVLETSLTVSDLSAVEATQPLRWDNPFQATGRMRKAESMWHLEDLSVTSPGVAIRGTGNLAQADFSVNLDLTRFQSEWNRVLDTSNWTTRGTLEGTFSSRQSGPHKYQLTGKADGKNISLGMTNSIPWNFPELKTAVSGSVLKNQQSILEDLTFELETGKERVFAQKKPDGIWNLASSGTLDGVISQWISRAPSDRLAGRYDFSTQLRQASPTNRFDNLKLTVEDLVWTSGNQRFDEKILIVEGQFKYVSTTGSIEIPALTLNSSTVAARLTEAHYEHTAERTAIAGQLAARGRLERFATLLGINSKNSTPHGLLSLQLKATAKANQSTEFQWKIFTEDLEWGTPRKGLPTHAVSWSPSSESAALDSEITFNGAGIYFPADQRIELRNSEFDAGFLQLNLSGGVTDLTTDPLLSVQGKCDYDWSILRLRFPDLFNPKLDLRGAHSSPVTFSLPLAPSGKEKMKGTIPIQWESARWSGLEIGPGRADAVFSTSRIDIQPMKTSVAGGTMQLSPSVIFTDHGKVIEQSPETIFDQVHLSEEICQTWLKYVSPLTADASRVEGTFSLETSKTFHFPIEDTRSATGTGILEIHSARMSPGPLAMQIVMLEKQIESIRKGTPFAGQLNADPRAILTIEQQVVPFEIKDGRVTHSNLKMKIKDLDLSTSGSVGFDETIDLTVEMEIPPSWTIQGKRLRDIWGASIQIPIRGSLKKPITDPRFVDALLKQLVRGSATNFLENQLNKQLNNLFGPKK